MSRAALVLVAFLLTVAARCTCAQTDSASPHNQTDSEICAVCHEPDMSLSRSRVETCTLCHAATAHGGSSEHLHADAARVAQAVPAGSDPAKLPLTDDGRIWCGTCHLYHDPSLLGPPWLTQGWVPPDTGMPAAVRRGLETRANDIVRQAGEPTPGATFATKGTRALRMPVADGSLCRHCHVNLP